MNYVYFHLIYVHFPVFRRNYENVFLKCLHLHSFLLLFAIPFVAFCYVRYLIYAKI